MSSVINWALTLGWIGFVFYLWQYSGIKKPDELNAVGDFLAGAFAPLAFFWLVRGFYLQSKGLEQNSKALKFQARELKATTDALNVQVEEMKNSVEQQQRVAEVYEEEMRQKHFQVRPFLNITCGDIVEGTEDVPIEDEDGEILDVLTQRVVDFCLRIENEGESARHLLLINKPGTPYKRFEKYELKQNEVEKIKFCIDGQACEALYNGHDIFQDVKITFNDVYGKLFTKYITCKISSHQDDATDKIHLYSNAIIKDKKN